MNATENASEQSSHNATTTLQTPREEQSTSQGHSNTLDNPGWGDRDANELPDYSEHIFWEPEVDSDNQESDLLKLSATTTKIVEDAFRYCITNDKRCNLKCKQPILDTPFTKCPKLESPDFPKQPRILTAIWLGYKLWCWMQQPPF